MVAIVKGNPIGKSDLVGQIVKGLVRNASVEKHSINGADAAFCSRKAALHYLVDAPEKLPLDPASTLYFAVGNAFHEEIHTALKNAGILLANELRIEYGPIHGFIDDIIISAETGRPKIIDVKTCGQLPAKIKPGQAEQLLAYALLTGIQEASILYVSRNVANFNGLMIKEIQASINATSMAKIARVMAEGLVAVSHNIVPPQPEYRITRDGCGWCPFKDNGCFSDSGGILPLGAGSTYNGLEPYEEEIAALTKKLLDSKAEFYAKTMKLLEAKSATKK